MVSSQSNPISPGFIPNMKENEAQDHLNCTTLDTTFVIYSYPFCVFWRFSDVLRGQENFLALLSAMYSHYIASAVA